MIRFLWFLFDFLVPRFITEDVAVSRSPGEDSGNWECWVIECAMSDVQPGERFDGIAEVDAFTWLGFGITYRIGNFRPWEGAERV